MLSRDEERELALLEESFREPAWRRLVNAVEHPVWRHRRKVRALFAFGVLLALCGGVTGSDDLTSQGCLVVVVVALYWYTMFVRDRPDPAPRAGRRRQRGR